MEAIRRKTLRALRSPGAVAILLSGGVATTGVAAEACWASAAMLAFLQIMWVLSRIWHDLNMDRDVILESIRRMGEF